LGSLFLSNISSEELEDLKKRLLSVQKGKCFICEKEIDLKLQSGSIDIDHVIPLKTGGKDDPSNFAITHSHCNRSKQASDLRVARVLARFSAIREECMRSNRGPNLDDIFRKYGGSRYDLQLYLDDKSAKYSFPELDSNTIFTSPVYVDELCRMSYLFAKIPIEYLFHDNRVNPRSIGNSISSLVEEFFKKRPQLHIALGWMNIQDGNKVHINIFDGQHKVAAQILLGIRELPIRIFINPDMDVLLATNTNAGTTLRQIAFDMSVRRHLGSELYIDRIERYQKDHNLATDNYSFSERDLVKHFRGESREMKRYILDAVRDSITHHRENRLKDFIDFGGRAKEKPLSYSTIEKTFYSFFIYQELLESPLDDKMQEGDNARENEKAQILKLMNIIAEEIYIGKFDPAIGTFRIESRTQKGEEIPENHLRAYRLSKEEILYTWLGYIRQIVKNHFITIGIPINEEKLFQREFPEPLWAGIRNFIHNLKHLPVWVNRELSLSVFGGKQNYEYWQTIFESGKSPQGQQVLNNPLNLIEMLKI
jgi:hypothetical protein